MRFAKIAIIVFILFDLAWSFGEFYNQPLQGDLIPLILPDDRNAPILSDPFGVHALSSETYHPNINRFFSSFSLYFYYRTVPFLFQSITHPVESLYLSSTVFKSIVLLGFLFVFTKMITTNLGSTKEKLLSVFILLPFFQSGGVLSSIELIGVSSVYNFFYGFPFLLLLFMLYGIFWSDRWANNIKLKFLFLAGLGIICAFSSALMPAVVLIGGSFFYVNRLADWIFKLRNKEGSNWKSIFDWKFYLINALSD